MIDISSFLRTRIVCHEQEYYYYDVLNCVSERLDLHIPLINSILNALHFVEYTFLRSNFIFLEEKKIKQIFILFEKFMTVEKSLY